MGSDPAPFMIQLFLCYYEDKCIRKTKRRDLDKARTFSNMIVLIDYLSAINDGCEFKKKLPS